MPWSPPSPVSPPCGSQDNLSRPCPWYSHLNLFQGGSMPQASVSSPRQAVNLQPCIVQPYPPPSALPLRDLQLLAHPGPFIPPHLFLPSIKTHANSTFFYKHSNISLFPVVLCTRFIIALPPPRATWRQDYIYNIFTEWTIEWTNESVKGELKTENTNACQPFTMSA